MRKSCAMIDPNALFEQPSINAAGAAWFDDPGEWERLQALGIDLNFRERFTRSLRAAIEEAKK